MKMLILADKGGRGIRHMLTLVDKWGGEVWLILKSLTKMYKNVQIFGFL